MALSNHISTREMNKFLDAGSEQTIVRVRENHNLSNTIEHDTLVVTTTAAAFELPESSNGFTLFHQTAGVKVYFGDSDVSTSDYPYLLDGDIMKIRASSETEIYFVTDASTATLFALTGVNE